MTMNHTVESILGRCIEEGDCMIWTGATTSGKSPLPLVSDPQRQNRVRHARPMLFTMLGMKRPKNKPLTIVSCWNSLCLSPKHMKAASKFEVISGAVSAGRYPINPAREARRREVARAAAKLSMDKAREIRRRYFAGESTMAALAADYGVHCSLVSKIIHNKAWLETAANASVFNYRGTAA
jgi:hypothetical protein